MLTIKKHPLSTKAALFGTVAFFVGLSGAGAYIERARQHENLVFDRVEAVLGTADERTTQGTSSNEAQRTAPSEHAASPQSASHASILTQDARSTSPSTPESAAVSPMQELAPGMGAGERPAPTPVTPPEHSPQTTTEPAQEPCTPTPICVITNPEDTVEAPVSP